MVDEESGGFFEKIGKMFGGKEEEENRAEVAKQVLKDVQAEIGFKIGEGKKIIVGLRELGDYLATVSEDDFEKHVNENKNDFSWWVTNSVGDRVLGERLKKIKDSAQMANEVYSRVKELTPYLSNKEEGTSNKEEGTSNKEEGISNKEEGQENKEEEKNILDVGIKSKKAAEGADEVRPEAKGKSVAELLAEEGVVATESAEGEGKEVEKSKSINDILMTIEKIDGKLDMFDQFRKSSDARVGDLAERIGELRQMLLDKERDFNEVQSGFERINDAIGDIKPNEIAIKLEKSAMELEKRDVKIEKLENQIATLMDEVSGYRARMARIKDFDNLIDSLNNIKEEVVKIDESKRYTDRIAAKSEHIFSELNEKVLMFKNQIAKVDKTDAIAQELMITADKLSTDMDKLASKDDLDNFRKDIQAQKFGVSKEDFGKSIAVLEAEVVKVSERLEQLDFKTKGSGELLEERRRLELYVDKTNDDYKAKKISESAYLELIKNSKKRLEEIDGVLKRLDREAMYKDLNNLTKVVNEHAVKFKDYAEGKEFVNLVKSVADLQHKFESSRIEKSLENLQEAKTNIFGRLATTEQDVRELDLRARDFAKLKDDIVSFRNVHKDFENLISGNIAEIDAVKGVLSSLENKLEGDLKSRIDRLEFNVTDRDDVTIKKLKIARDEMEMMVKDKLKSLALFGEEIKALREGKSMMFDKINSNERGLESINSLLAGMRGELRIFGPKVSAIENSVEGNLVPSVIQLRSKIGDLDLIRGDLEVLKMKVNEVVGENLEGKIEGLEGEILELRRGLYGD
ncbi:hypothetical protein J4226_02095 [Candidatus Pacearchaeota archaeon]|nr:hypothetical protein [Candidatus Pacearchaeota archaeon]